jgi:hypothetical protein
VTIPKDTAHAAVAQIVPVGGKTPPPASERPTPDLARATGAAPESADLFDYALLRDYGVFAMRAPRRHKLLALLAFVAVVAVGVASLAILPKKYVVQTRLLAQRNQVMGSVANPGLARPYELDARTRSSRSSSRRIW